MIINVFSFIQSWQDLVSLLYDGANALLLQVIVKGLFCSFSFHTYVERDALCACSLWLKEDLWLVNLHLKMVEANVSPYFLSQLPCKPKNLLYIYHPMGKQLYHLYSYELFLLLCSVCLNLLVVSTDDLTHIGHTAVAYFYGVSIEVFFNRGASWKMFVNQE